MAEKLHETKVLGRLASGDEGSGQKSFRGPRYIAEKFQRMKVRGKKGSWAEGPSQKSFKGQR
jgi:hypothetical protein